MQAIRPVALRAPARQIGTVRQALPRSAFRNARSSLRYASTEAKTGGGSGALAGGLAGGVTAFLLGYGWYRWSGTAAIVDYGHQAKARLDGAFKSATDSAPKPNEAVQWLKKTVEGYTQFIPGANQYVETAFKDVEKVQEKHGDEVNKIIGNAYDELKGITKQGATLGAAAEAWNVLQKVFKQVGHLAGDAAEDILDNHPEAKEKIGGQYKQLRQMAEQYGPEAKQQADDTIKQVQDIVKGGLNTDTINKVQKLVQEKTQELKKYGDKAWEEGMKQAQPVLDKYPQLKEQVENNKDKLLKGDLGQLWNKVQEASKSGSTDDLQKFVQDQVQKGQQSFGGGGIEHMLGSMFPGGKDVGAKIQQLQELSQKHGKEAESLVKSAFEDIKKVLEKKVDEGKQLKDKAENDAK